MIERKIIIIVDVVTFERYCSFSYSGPVSKRKSDWISARIYYFPHHVTEYPDSGYPKISGYLPVAFFSGWIFIQEGHGYDPGYPRPSLHVHIIVALT